MINKETQQHDIELLDRLRSLAELKANADIRARSQAADGDADYSRRIREGLADPNPKPAVAEPVYAIAAAT